MELHKMEEKPLFSVTLILSMVTHGSSQAWKFLFGATFLPINDFLAGFRKLCLKTNQKRRGKRSRLRTLRCRTQMRKKGYVGDWEHPGVSLERELMFLQSPKKSKKDKKKDDDEPISTENLSPIAHPLAQKKLVKKLHKTIKKGGATHCGPLKNS